MSTAENRIRSGALRRVSRAEYDAIDALNYSGLKEFARSPAHYVAAKNAPSEPTAAMIFGSAFHSLVLEPERFSDAWAVLPAGLNRRTNAGKAAFELWEAENAGRGVVSAEDFELLTRMSDAVRSHPIAGALLKRAERTEICAEWTDAYSNNCKALLDAVAFLNTPNTTIYDLKTTTDASADEFSRAIGRYRYHWQAAFYSEALAASGYEPRNFCFVAVEKSEPFGVTVSRLSPESIDAATAQMRPLRKRFAECRKSNNWPGFEPKIYEISAPKWALINTNGGDENEHE